MLNMSDMFTLKTVPLNSEIGMALKNFRIQHNVTAKSIITEFKKSSSYMTKLENGDIKKIDSKFLIKLCNFITQSDTGLEFFLEVLSVRYLDLSGESQVIANNIDKLLIEHTIPQELIEEIVSYMKEHNISVSQLADKINDNTELKELDGYSDMPINVFFLHNSTVINNICIKLSVPEEYLEDLLFYNKYIKVHSVIMEAILYSLYRIGSNDNGNMKSRFDAIERLNFYNITSIISSQTDEEIDISGIKDHLMKIFNANAYENYEKVCEVLKDIVLFTKNYGTNRIKQMAENMSSDPSFSFAFMSTDLTPLKGQSKGTKQAFLNDLNRLIDSHSSVDIDTTTFDTYDD